MKTQVLDFFKHDKFDLVFHTALFSDTQKCEREPDLAEEINVKSTLNIVKACTLKNSTLIFVSSLTKFLMEIVMMDPIMKLYCQIPTQFMDILSLNVKLV